MGLQQFERRLERLVEGVFARAFKSGVAPVELARRITREMDSHRTVGVRGGLITPNSFRVALSPADHGTFASAEDALAAELAEAVREHARDEGYGFVGPVGVTFERDPALGSGQFLVASEIRQGEGGPVGSLVLPDGSRIPIAEEPITIGRLPECEIVVTDPNVSRRHAEVRRSGNDITVVDLGSTNGTRVNGGGIRERKLGDGDEITVGTTRIRFEAS